MSCQQAEVSPWREIGHRVPPAQLRAPQICAEASPEMLLADAARHSGVKQPLPITVPGAMVLGRSSQGMGVESVGRPPFRDRIAQYSKESRKQRAKERPPHWTCHFGVSHPQSSQGGQPFGDAWDPAARRSPGLWTGSGRVTPGR